MSSLASATRIHKREAAPKKTSDLGPKQTIRFLSKSKERVRSHRGERVLPLVFSFSWMEEAILQNFTPQEKDQQNPSNSHMESNFESTLDEDDPQEINPCPESHDGEEEQMDVPNEREQSGSSDNSQVPLTGDPPPNEEPTTPSFR